MVERIELFKMVKQGRNKSIMKPTQFLRELMYHKGLKKTSETWPFVDGKQERE